MASGFRIYYLACGLNFFSSLCANKKNSSPSGRRILFWHGFAMPESYIIHFQLLCFRLSDMFMCPPKVCLHKYKVHWMVKRKRWLTQTTSPKRFESNCQGRNMQYQWQTYKLFKFIALFFSWVIWFYNLVVEICNATVL